VGGDTGRSVGGTANRSCVSAGEGGAGVLCELPRSVVPVRVCAAWVSTGGSEGGATLRGSGGRPLHGASAKTGEGRQTTRIDQCFAEWDTR